MPPATAATFTTEVVRSWDAIASRWNELSALAAFSPFQTGPWIENWYAILGKLPGIEPLFVVVRDTRTGCDAIIIPLIRRFADGLNHIEFADLWVTDYNAPLIHPEFDGHAIFEEWIWPQVLAEVSPADFLNFTKMPLTIAGRPNPIAAVTAATASSTSGHVIALPPSWDDYLATLSKDTRRTMKKRWTRFSERAGSKLRRITSENQALPVLETLQAQQVARLDERGARHVFNDPDYRDFYRRYALNGLSNGSVALYALYDGADIVATFFGLISGDTCTLIRSSQSQDERLKPYSLGRLIMLQSLEDLHERGCRVFDLSIGAHAYKQEFKVAQVPLADLTLRLSWRALPFVAKRHALGVLARHPRVLAFAKALSGKAARPAA